MIFFLFIFFSLLLSFVQVFSSLSRAVEKSLFGIQTFSVVFSFYGVKSRGRVQQLPEQLPASCVF